MSLAYRHCFLQCPNSHAIPVPHPSLLATDSSPRWSAKGNRSAIAPTAGLCLFIQREILSSIMLLIHQAYFKRASATSFP
jgi:hypothetical protein